MVLDSGEKERRPLAEASPYIQRLHESVSAEAACRQVSKGPAAEDDHVIVLSGNDKLPPAHVGFLRIQSTELPAHKEAARFA